MRETLQMTRIKPLVEITNLKKSFGSNTILKDINLSVYPGEFLTLLGPSGCGKTTLLRLISGFETATDGQILLDGHCVSQLPPQQRDIHTVFQSYALFPHLNVYENVAFALRCQKLPESDIKTRVHEALTQVHLTGFDKRDIKQLSGGQQQRVAIARAIVNRPKVLLLDEPLSSLDHRLRKNMQSELKHLQKELNMTFIFVTHDQEEALSMSDRIAVFNHGHIEQIGTPREVYETPESLFVAGFIGEANIFDLDITKADAKNACTVIENREMCCNNTGNFSAGDKIHMIIRPEDIRVWSPSEVKNKDTQAMLPATISEITYKGKTVDLSVTLASGRVIYASEFFDEDDGELDFELGEQVFVEWYSGWEVLLPYEK